MNTTQRLRLIAAACLILGVAACNRKPTEADVAAAKADENKAAQEVKVAAARAGDQLADSWITTKIQAQYFADQDIKARYINVSTRDGRVVLKGRVDNQNAHDQAVQTARNTDGVRDVVDELRIGPAVQAGGARTPEQMDAAWIATKIQAKYFADPNVKGRNINVFANNGVVTLSGHVDTDAERQHAAEVARSTDGVWRVQNDLVVQPSSGPVATTGATRPSAIANQMDDMRITASIQSKFFLDDRVKGRRINVDTRQGVVTLQGEVGSESERAQALLLARTTDGVQRVEDGLMVTGATGATGASGLSAGASAKADAPAATGPPATTAVRQDDDVLTTKIQSRFFLDDQVRLGAIEVTSKDGVVLLQGTVPNAAARQKAIAIAQDTDGVAQVVDRLKVAPPKARRGKGTGGRG